MKSKWLFFILSILFFTACDPRTVNTPGAGGLFLIDGGGMDEPEIKTNNSPLPAEPPAQKEEEPIMEVKETDFWEEQLAAMTVEEKIGQLIVCRLPSNAAEVNDEIKKLTEECHVGGYILFSENAQSAEQVRKLTDDLQALSSIPLIIATDEEGGRVSRVGRFFEEKIPAAYTLGQSGDPEKVYDAMRTTGENLLQLGINMDFAPVADIWSNDANTVIGNRAYGKDAETVSVMVEAAVRGLKDAGVLSVLKHFPGHGDTAEDSHKQIAVYPYAYDRFISVEAVPFTRGIAAGADGVMVGHIATPSVMADDDRIPAWAEPWHAEGRLPAVFSPFWIEDTLRSEMAFDGLIVTDALEMNALTDSFTVAQTAVGAFLAGADMLLIPPDPYEAADALLNAYKSGVFGVERLDASVRRILRVKAMLNPKING